MRKAFTLIELLIVLVIMVLVIGIIGPQGAKMLERYKKNFLQIQEKHQIYQTKVDAFLLLKEENITIEDINYTINIKGVIIEKSNDNY